MDCSSCGVHCMSMKSWLGHLSDPRHLEWGRSQLLENRKWKETRDCLIMVTSELPVVTIDDELLRYFSNPGDDGHRATATATVTDFIWWDQRPEIALIQFRNRNVLQDLIIRTVNKNKDREGKLTIGGQKVKVRRGEKFSDAEWDVLFESITTHAPRRMGRQRKYERDVNTTAAAGSSSEIGRSNIQIEFDEDYFSHIIKTEPTERDASPNPIPDNLHGDFDWRKSHGPDLVSPFSTSHFNDSSPTPAAPPSAEDEGTMPIMHVETIPSDEQDQQRSNQDILFNTHFLGLVRKEVEIPDEEYKAALTLACQIHNNFCNNGEEMAVTLFRNWSQKLRYHKIKTPLVLVINGKEADNSHDRAIQLHKIVVPPITMCTNYNSNPHDPNIVFESAVSEHYQIKINGLKSALFQSLPSHFVIFRHSCFIMEDQVWRLANYLCSFESVSQRLIEVMYFWANINEIRIGVLETANVVTDPMVLTWMVIFFLCRKKIIPTPEMVLERDHHRPVMYPCPFDSKERVDIGFEKDDNYRIKWGSNAHRQATDSKGDIFTLVIELFQLWGTFSRGSWVINTGKGKYCGIDTYLKLNIRNKNDSDRQLKRLQNNLSGYQNQKKKSDKRRAKEERIYMTNPFCPTWSFMINRNALKVCKKTSIKLQDFLSKDLKDKKLPEASFNRDELRSLFKDG